MFFSCLPGDVRAHFGGGLNRETWLGQNTSETVQHRKDVLFLFLLNYFTYRITFLFCLEVRFVLFFFS